MTDASTLAGEKVLGSFSREITLSRMVLKERGIDSREIKTRTWGREDGDKNDMRVQDKKVYKGGKKDKGFLGILSQLNCWNNDYWSALQNSQVVFLFESCNFTTDVWNGPCIDVDSSLCMSTAIKR